LFAKLTGFFGALALILVCVRLYGVMSYTVARCTNEISIRMALGAQRGNILGMVLRQVLLLVGIGVALGIAGSFATARLAEATVSGLLFGLKINDATVIVFAAVVLVAVATLAGLVPARRASHVDPTVALRYE
jgi:ABC-type antimicrobial peptide transport system permease subunit